MANYLNYATLVLNSASLYNTDNNHIYKMPHGQESENIPTFCIALQAFSHHGESAITLISWYADETNLYFPLSFENNPMPIDFPASISVAYGIQDIIDLSI